MTPEGEDAINIGAAMRREVEERMESCPVDLFDDCQKHVSL